MTQEIRIRRWLAFLLAALLAFSTLSTALAAGKTFQSYQTTSMSNVNLRKRANGTSTILKRIKVGDTVTIVGKSGNYYQIQFDGKEGYALIKYIDGTDSGADPEPDESLMHAAPLAVTSYPYDTTTLGYVKLRKKANRTADVYCTIPVNSLVTVLSVEGDFARVEYDGQKGYVYAKYVNLANIPTPTPVPTATPKPGSESYALIKSGDTGAMVTALQQALIELKYLSEGDAQRAGADRPGGRGTAAADLRRHAQGCEQLPPARQDHSAHRGRGHQAQRTGRSGHQGPDPAEGAGLLHLDPLRRMRCADGVRY